MKNQKHKKKSDIAANDLLIKYQLAELSSDKLRGGVYPWINKKKD